MKYKPSDFPSLNEFSQDQRNALWDQVNRDMGSRRSANGTGWDSPNGQAIKAEYNRRLASKKPAPAPTPPPRNPAPAPSGNNGSGSTGWGSGSSRPNFDFDRPSRPSIGSTGSGGNGGRNVYTDQSVYVDNSVYTEIGDDNEFGNNSYIGNNEANTSINQTISDFLSGKGMFSRESRQDARVNNRTETKVGDRNKFGDGLRLGNNYAITDINQSTGEDEARYAGDKMEDWLKVEGNQLNQKHIEEIKCLALSAIMAAMPLPMLLD